MTLEVAEGIAGVFNYHLRDTDQQTIRSGVCGRPVMQTKVPLTAWGVKTHLGIRIPTHLNECWCVECAKHLPAATETE